MNANLSATASNTGSVTVATAAAADAVHWDAYVDAHDEGTFFHLFAWQSVLAESVGFKPMYLIARRHGRIVGVLPLMTVSSLLFGSALVSLPFCVEGGVLADDLATQSVLIEAARDAAVRARVDYLELRHSRRMTADWPCKDSTYVSFKKALAATPDDNMKEIPRKQRAVVRKGIAAGLITREETDIETFFTIYATSVRNLGTPVFPKRYFAKLYAAFRERCRITVVYSDSIAVAAVISFLYKDIVMPYYGGGTPAARELKAFDFMYWEVMRSACERGMKWFDYGRSKVDSGSYSFKKNWGFEPTPLHYEYHLVKARSVPNRNPNNPKYEMAVNAWRHLPLPIANTVGAWISPYLA
ncbi:MAG: FemAB family PEP-CTERM system-associated protein [Gammaproteobacteria bacterium]|nr:FemAB family PEP-CTERM system-associated protein [Gammaproteobacteria bacterium]